MPMSPEEHRPLNDMEVDERATEAQVLLSNPVFIDALEDVYSRAIGTLMGAEVGSLTASTAHATMKALSEVRSQLEAYIVDRKMRQKYKGKPNG